MKDPGITPMPWRAQTIPARAMRTPKMTAIMRMGRRTRRRPLRLGHAESTRLRPQASAAGRHEAFVLAPTPVQFLDLVWRSVAREVSEACLPDVADAVRGTCGEVHGRIGSQDLLLVTGEHLSPALENVVHRLDGAVLVEPRAPARSDIDDRDDEFPGADVGRSDELVGQAPVSLESLRLLAWYDLHGPPSSARSVGDLEFPYPRAPRKG